MKAMKKILSLMLVLAMLLSFAVPAMAAEPDFTLSLDKTSYKVGETAYVTVKLNKSYTMCNLNLRVWYDPDVFTYDETNSEIGDALTSCSLKNLTDPVASNYNKLENYTVNGWKPVNITAAYLGEDDTFSGTLAVIAFTVTAESESAPFSITLTELSNINSERLTSQATVGQASYVETKAESAADVNGYTITASEDKNIVAGEEATVSFKVGNKDAATYNAYDLTFTYDTSLLTLKEATAADTSATIDKDTAGSVHVVGYGENKNVDTDVVTLKFTGAGIGTANVKVTSAKVDISAKAIDSNAPEATLLDDTTVITIAGYTVDLDEGLSGESTVAPGGDYTFTATDWANYDYNITATMDGETAEVTDNKDGTYTIKNVTGNLDISATMTPKSYTVTINGDDTTGAATATYNTAYTFTIDKKDGFDYDVKVRVGTNEDYKGYSVSGNTYTIPGTDITGDITITVTKTASSAEYVNVSFEGSGAGDVNNPVKTVKKGASYTFTLNKAVGYSYTVTAKIGETDVTVTENENGSYTIANVSGNLTITVTKTSDLTVEVNEYITLDEKAMYLVTASGTIAEGSVAKYDGMAMYWSGKYNAYAWLVVSADGLDAVKTDAAQKVTIAEGTAAGTVDYSCDVNATGLVDVNDAQLTYDMYNGKYEDFETVSMLKFLNADVSTDETSARKLNVSDAAAIVNTILNPATEPTT